MKLNKYFGDFICDDCQRQTHVAYQMKFGDTNDVILCSDCLITVAVQLEGETEED